MAIVSGSCARVNGSRNGPSVSATPSGSVGQSQPMIAVWEWQDDQGHWRPYSGQVSAHIERCLAPRGHRGGGPGTTSICLGQSDPSLSSYLIDVPSLKQFRQDTGESSRAHLLSVNLGFSPPPHRTVVPPNPSVPRPNSEASHLALAFRDAVVCDACLRSKQAKISHIANLSEVTRSRYSNKRYIREFCSLSCLNLQFCNNISMFV